MSLLISNQAPKVEKFLNQYYGGPPKYLHMDQIIKHSPSHAVDTINTCTIQEIYEVYPEHRDEIFSKIFKEITSLSKDEKGNFFIRKIINCEPYGSERITRLLLRIKNDIPLLSEDFWGTFVIQILIEKCKETNLTVISKELNEHYIKLAEDNNGSRVIQALIKRQNKNENNKIYEKVENKLIYLANTKSGCYVIKALLNYSSEKTYGIILQRAYENLDTLIKNKYGNYLIKFILDKEKEKKGMYLNKFYEVVKNNFFIYSINKHAVYVVEKILKEGDDCQKKKFINSILESSENKNNYLAFLSINQYGNYVVKLLLELSDMDTRKKINEKIKSHPKVKRKEGYSKYIVNYLESLGFK